MTCPSLAGVRNLAGKRGWRARKARLHSESCLSESVYALPLPAVSSDPRAGVTATTDAGCRIVSGIGSGGDEEERKRPMTKAIPKWAVEDLNL